MSSISPHDELNEFGYTQKFLRTIKSFDSFAVAFSFISITTGIFTTFGFLLATGGPRGLWTWPIVIIGQYFVAMIYGALSSRIPLAGYSYQWGSRLAGWRTGWWLGWISMCFLFIVVVSVDYAFVQVAFQPLIGQAYTPTSAAVETAITIAVQGFIIFASTKTTARLNSAAVVTEVAGIVVLVLALVIGAISKHHGHISNIFSTGSVPAEGYWKWIGPFMLSTLLGAYTVVGFEAASNLAEETDNARQVIGASMRRAVAVSGIMGMLLLLGATFAIHDMAATTKSASPIAYLVEENLGTVASKLLLFVVCVSIFACGMINLMTNTRLIYAMGRDGRLPAHKSLAQAPKPTGGPSWATATASAISIVIVLTLSHSSNALTTLFSAATIMPALSYLRNSITFP
jgi:amino acid transporter